MILNFINYLVRILIIILGVLFVSGFFGLYFPVLRDNPMVPVMGVIFILWGVYRIVTYWSFRKKIERDEDEE